MVDEQVVVNEDTATTGKAPTSAKRPRRQMEITLFDRWCKGCGLCSTFCPTHAIEADEEGRPKAIYPERCTGCQWCVIHCPDLAISVRQINGRESDE